MKFLCIVPIYNEELRLRKLIDKIILAKKTIKKLDFLLINNGSTDNSKNLIKKSNLKSVSFNKNYGIGYALIFGLKYAKKKKYSHIIHLAGNGKMNPMQILKFKKKIKDFHFISGSRFLRYKDRKNNPIQRIIMIWLLSKFISFLYSRKITDATCGFRMFKVSLLSNDLSFFNKKRFYTYRYEYYSFGKILLKKNIKFTEVPVTMNYTKVNYSKIKPVIDWLPIISGWIEPKINAIK